MPTLAFFLPAVWRGANPRLAALLDWLIGVLIVIAILCGIFFAVRHAGEKAGAARVERRIGQAHAAAVTEAYQDTTTAAAASTAVATDIARRTAASTATTHVTIEDLHHAIDAVPPAAAGAALPAAPVDGVRASLNAAIDRANRAADAADAVP